ncbi:MAG: polyamine aminopropyltransferase [Pseudomonadota bacterium]
MANNSLTAGFPTKTDEGSNSELWFYEDDSIGLKSSLRLRIKSTICSVKSQFQEISVFETAGMGRMLVLDGVIMLTEFDEFAYHEMISHVPLCVHPDPKKVLVIGGGDGGTVREVLKHPSVEEIHLCEIDKGVVDVSKEHLKFVASCLDDPRVRLYFQDGAAFIEQHPNEYDVIITDSSDPIGPASVLFHKKYFKAIYDSLKENGIAVQQCESIFYHTKFIKDVLSALPDIFPVVSYYYAMVPTYPSGMIGFTFCSKKHMPENIDEEKGRALKDIKYYTPSVHRSAFCLPRFAEDLMRK